MALKVSFRRKSNFGVYVDLTDTYVRIETFGGNKTSMTADVYCYSEKDGEFLFKERLTFQPNLDTSDNFLAQGYAALKQEPEYASAIDV